MRYRNSRGHRDIITINKSIEFIGKTYFKKRYIAIISFDTSEHISHELTSIPRSPHIWLSQPKHS